MNAAAESLLDSAFSFDCSKENASAENEYF